MPQHPRGPVRISRDAAGVRKTAPQPRPPHQEILRARVAGGNEAPPEPLGTIRARHSTPLSHETLALTTPPRVAGLSLKRWDVGELLTLLIVMLS